ncbi:ankyrin repeat-containing protein [Pyrus ussuriensis x Pyrus communis]|uniref:Ankyrin repeat-containing protein n=1 Tax=Pyrus ussuriensis x Pyrus communis TaxID=2448454 RepID=A0A5N5IB53_9ROSA|nr:ankyrin repeat-containing protein [Pyrus ussuriensis x Pyrus communis]
MLDILEYSGIARDEFSRSLEIQQILIDAGLIRRENNENDKPNSNVAAAAVVSPNPRRVKKKKKFHKRVASSEKGSTPARRCWIKLMEWLRYPSNWVVETRGMLMVVATMISTMTFQAVVNPPGGVWDHNDTNTTFGNITVCSETSVCKAGTAVLRYGTDDPNNYFPSFITCNTISFLASLTVTLLLVSGFPLHSRLCTWLLSMSMSVTLTFMALTYLIVLNLIVPPDSAVDTPIYKIFFYIWIALLGIAGVMHTIRFLIWVTKWLRPMYFRSKLRLKNMISTGSFSCNDAACFEEIDLPVVV